MRASRGSNQGMAENFRALVADKDGDDVNRELTELGTDDLPEGEVTVRVGWSSVNYKDALAVSPKGQVAKLRLVVETARDVWG